MPAEFSSNPSIQATLAINSAILPHAVGLNDRDLETHTTKTNTASPHGPAASLDAQAVELRVRLRLAETEDAVAGLPLSTTLEDFDALEPFEDVALCGDGAGTFQTAVL